jgi:hypothetical protein
MANQSNEQQFQWILYDGRADALGDTFEASVLESFASRRDLKANLYSWRGHDGVLFEYDVNGNELLNERRIGHLREGKAALLAKCSRHKTALKEVAK